MSRKLVLASNNPGKLREFSALLMPFGFDPVKQADLGISEADEPHVTFVENALAKARHASRLAGMPALADDSGLVVPALGGAPGVYSARYAAQSSGESKSDERNNEKLLADLAALPAPVDRRAHYVCLLVFVRHADDPQPMIAEAQWHGEIVDKAQGDGGFGYDPYFWLPEYSCTAAQLSAAEKNRVSHRGQAMAQLEARLRQALADGELT